MKQHQVLSTSACILCLLYAAAHVAAIDLSYGRQIILQRGLQIQSLAFVSSTPVALTDYSLWASAGFTTFNSWNDKNSEKILEWTMPWSRWIKTDGSNPLTTNETNQHLSELVSLQYGDELNQNLNGALDATTINTMAGKFSDWHSLYGNNFLAYTNFGANNAAKSMTPAALSNYLQIAKPDMLMFDAYPRHYVTTSTWYTEMQKYRLAGLAGIDGTGGAPIPYAQYWTSIALPTSLRNPANRSYVCRRTPVGRSATHSLLPLSTTKQIIPTCTPRCFPATAIANPQPYSTRLPKRTGKVAISVPHSSA